MEATHPDLFHDVPRATFRAEAAKLADAAPGLSRDELVVGLMRLAALPGARDGHTAVFPFDQHARALHVYPLRLYDFPDGLYVVGSIGAEDLTGRRITAIDGTPIDEVVERVRPLVPHDNESGLRWLLPEFVARPRCCAASGSSRATATFAFADGTEATLEPVGAGEVASTLGGAPAPPPTEHDPVWLRSVDDPQWLTTLEGGRVVYLGYRSTTDATYDVAERLFALAGSLGPPRRRRRPPQPRRRQHDLRPAARRALTAGHPAQAGRPHRADDVLGRRQLRRRRRPRHERALRRRAGRRRAEPVGRLDHDHARASRSHRPRRDLVLGVRAAGGHAPGDPVDVRVEPTAADFFAGRDPVLARALALP